MTNNMLNEIAKYAMQFIVLVGVFGLFCGVCVSVCVSMFRAGKNFVENLFR